MQICITGSAGLIGSSCADYYLSKGHQVIGIDNNSRKKFFGTSGSTEGQLTQLKKRKGYTHFSADITNQKAIESIFKKYSFDAIIHCAGQPSHDKAKEIPLLDFSVNALGTLQILELTRRHQAQAVFIFTSTNKVYGDNPNTIPLRELKKRFDFADNKYLGVSESCSIDQSTHSLFGVSKTAADLYTQEYGKYFGLKTAVLRLSCITGSQHAGVPLHGFLSYLVKSLLHTQKYEIIGYKGKQVRDQLDAYDLASATAEIIKKPVYGEVFNLGGGRNNAASVLELIEQISNILDIKPKISFIKEPRVGDHICYITDLTKFNHFYPSWKVSKSVEQIITEIIDHEKELHGNSRS